MALTYTLLHLQVCIMLPISSLLKIYSACIVWMKEEDRLDANLKEGYLYETIG